MMKKVAILFLIFFSWNPFLWSQTANPQAAHTEAAMSSLSRLATSILGGNGSNAGGATVQTDEFSGAETYSLAIPVPPGRGAITPSLALNYNSQRKNPNSWVGYGWELDVGSISRLPASDGMIHYEDGVDFEVRLSGQAETLSRASTYQIGDYPTAADDDHIFYSHVYADVYSAKIESAFTKYFHLKSSYNGGRPDSWVVLDKSGIYYVFEQREFAFGADATRVGENRVGRWLLTNVIDPNNNNLRVRYNSDGSLQQLEYQDITVYFNVDYLSTDPTDQRYFPSFREVAQPRGQLAKVLKQISILSGDEVLQRYRFNYEVTPYRRVRQLVSVQQFGPRDDQALPPITFEYYPENNFEFSPTEQTYSTYPSEFGIQSQMTGPLSTFADMNGDGLVDHLTVHDGYFEVFYNNGNNFLRTDSTRWEDPFPCDDAVVRDSRGDEVFREDSCRRMIYDYTTGSGDSHQRLFLMDINGDSLPDRIQKRIVRNYNTPDETAYYRIAFGNGHGWSRVEDWEDPHHGYDAGLADKRQNFVDMNGDGLPDIVVGGNEQDYFQVYYNNGGGFNSTPVRWDDPLARWGHEARGKIYDFDGESQYLMTRDFNGDGLPDRILRSEFFDRSGHTVGMGFMVFMNVGGAWAMPTFTPGTDRVQADGYSVIAVFDLVQDEDSRGFVNSQNDLMDMNNDGYLDRVEGDIDRGVIRVSFYQGTLLGNQGARFSSSIEITDPLPPNQVEYRVIDDPSGSHIIVAQPKTLPGRGILNADDGDGRHYTWLMDVNGDGFPDRFAVKVTHTGVVDPAPHPSPRAILTGTTFQYEMHALNVNAVEFLDAPAFWNNRKVNQPVGILKSVRSGQGGRIALEYQPSTWRWDDHTDSDHRFLPFPLHVVRNIYSEDATLRHGPHFVLHPPFREGRYPGMRLTQYQFKGGNYYIRYAQKLNPTNPEDSRLSKTRVARFNGFHEVTKIISPDVGESWRPVTTTTFYTQARSEAEPISSARRWHYPILVRSVSGGDYFGHFALSGKPYAQIVVEGDRLVSQEDFNYDINEGADNFECREDALLHVLPCYPRLISHRKRFWDVSGPERVSEVTYRYDSGGNITHETHTGAHGLLVDVETQYTPASSFNQSRIQNRPSLQIKTGGDGRVYRKKSFGYDRAGNPVEERYFEDVAGSHLQVLRREFYPNGNLRQTTDVDGVVKQITYSSQDLFPESETILGPGSDRTTTTRHFLRLNGEVLSEVGPTGIGKGAHYDAFGRPIDNYIIDTSGRETVIKRMQYDFMTATINGWPNIVVQKTQSWDYKPDYPSETRPTSIAYASSGFSQQCSFSERGNYRAVYAWTANAGREESKTDSVFTDSCDLSSSIPAGVTIYHTQKDLLGRVTYADAPPGDTQSPLGDVRISYATNADRHLVKTTTGPLGQTIIEEYDDKDRLFRKTDSLRTTMEYRFNPVDDLTDVYQGSQLLTHLEYDMLGRKTLMTDSDMGTWHYYYDPQGRLDYQEDAAHQKIKNDYDSLSRIWKKTYRRADDSIEKYEMTTFDRGEDGYDVRVGELYKVAEFAGDGSLLRQTRYSYADPFRRNSRVSRLMPRVGEFHQDSHYDILGRVISTQYPGGQKLTQEYMRHGGLLRVCNDRCSGAGSEIYYSLDPMTSFDVNGSLLKEFYGNGVESDYTYYPHSKRLQNKKTFKGDQTYFNRDYTYDEMANVKSLSDNLHSQGSGALADIQYDSLDRLTRFQYAGSTRVDRVDYDETGNILKNTASYGEVPYQYTSPRPHAVTQIGTEHFGYDANGNMISDNYRHMDYNANNQLIRVTMNNHDVINYDYDFSGSRVSKRVERHLLDGRTERKTTYYLGDVMEIRDDQLTLNVYATGRRVATRTAGRISTMTGAAGGTLMDVGIDPDLRGTLILPYVMLVMTLLLIASLRPIKSPSIPLLQRGRWIPHFMKGGLGGILHLWKLWKSWTDLFQETLRIYPKRAHVKSFMLLMIILTQVQPWILSSALADDGAPPVVATDADYLYYNHDDHLGSSALLTEGKEQGRHSGLVYRRGDLLQRFEYAPFGRETFSLNPNLNFDPSYTGQRYDIETGLYYYKARYYNPVLGRFIQPDTIIPNAKNLQDYNRYTYVNNNPMKYVDPSGHFWGMFRRIFAAVIAAVLAVVTFFAMGPAGPVASWTIGQVAFAGMISGMVGGFAGGLISGGAQEAMIGAFFGAFSGALFGAAGQLISQQIGQSASFAIMTGIGASLSYSTGGWKGLVLFGASIFGGLIASPIAKKISISKILNESYYDGEPYFARDPTHKLTLTEVDGALDRISEDQDSLFGGYYRKLAASGKKLLSKGELVLADLNAEPGKKTYTGGNYKNGVITIDENLGVSYLEHVLLHELVHADLALNSNLAAGTKLSEFWARYYQTDYNGGNFNAEAAMNFISTTSSYINLPHH